MPRKLLAGCLLVACALFFSGCVALLAGAGGTALWHGGKIISEERGTIARTVDAAKAAFRAKKITLTGEVIRDQVTQLRGEDLSHAKVAVDVFETGPHVVRVEIRVGLGEKIAARDLLSEIKRRM